MVGLILCHTDTAPQTHTACEDTGPSSTQNLRHGYIFRYTLTQVYLCRSTDTATPPPTTTRKVAAPTGTIKSSFTAQGVMGTSRQLGGAGGLRVRAVPDLCSSHSAPGSGRLHFLTHPPLSPTPVTPSFFHCCLKSDHTLLQQLSLKAPPALRPFL